MPMTPARGLSPILSALALPLLLGLTAWGQGSGSTRITPPQPAPPARAVMPPTPAPAYRQPAPADRQPAPAVLQPQPAPAVARPQTAEEYQRSLWRFLVRPQAPYTTWPAPAGKAGFRKVEGPHGPLARTYANSAAAGDPRALPYDAILVLEDYAGDRKTRTGINVMYRVRGFDPAHNDWYWMKLNEDGTVARTPAAEGNAPIAGRVAACIACHQKAGGNDLTFANDPAGLGAGK